MKIYRLSSGGTKCYTILIEEDDGELRTSTVGLSRVVEHVAKPYVTKSGAIRLIYGGGSSMPYKNSDGTISERWREI
jgi:hypothetical protein